MKHSIRIVVLCVAAVVGLALGWLWRAHLLLDSRPARGTAQQTLAGAGNATKPRGDDSPLATRLEKELHFAKGVTRWLCWMDTLEKAAPSDYPRLVSLARGEPVMLHFLAQHWIETSPGSLFEHLLVCDKQGRTFSTETRQLAQELFQTWPKRDPEAAIAAMNTHMESALFWNWNHLVAEFVVQTDVERGLRLMADWQIDHTTTSQKSIRRWAQQDPQHAAEFALQTSTGDEAKEAAQTIGQQWGKIDPAAALSFSASHPGELGSALGRTVLEQWAKSSLTDAAAWLSNADAETRNRFSSGFVKIWAQDDATAALDWCNDNLSGSALDQAVKAAAEGVASKDLSQAANLIQTIESPSARAEAAVAVARHYFSLSFDVKSVAPGAISWLQNLDTPTLNAVLEQVQWEWATADYKSMADFLAAGSQKEIRNESYLLLAQQMARQDPTEALNWASHLSGGLSLQTGSAAFAEWRNWQPEAAMAWFEALPESDPRRQPFFKAAIRTLAWSPQAVGQVASLPPGERETARTVIGEMSLPAERRSALLQALGSPAK